MIEEITISKGLVKSYDPTHTTTLRKVFSNAMKQRFNELLLLVVVAIVRQDCFGLSKDKLVLHQMTPPSWQQFNYARNADKLEAFMKWLNEQVDNGILEVGHLRQIGRPVEDNWMNIYLFDSYKRGVIRARYEMRKAGFDVKSIDESGGIDIVMGLPFHIDRLGLIFARAYSDLKGITADMDTIISRILAQGLADGDGPALLARKLVAAINGSNLGDLALKDSIGRFIPALQRATLLSRTGIIRAHHLATIQEYRNWGVLGVTVKGEWITAGDNRVCPKCASMEGKIFTLDEIEYMIPLHPDCRCMALPYFEDLVKYE